MGSKTRISPGMRACGLCSVPRGTNAVSRRLVFAAHRDGGQRQFVERPVLQMPDESLGPLPAWAQERLGEPLTVADLAARAAVSPATLHRRFQANSVRLRRPD